MGGFHVSGVLSMLLAITPEIQDAMDLGISILAGEIEHRFDGFLEDAHNRQLKPVYNCRLGLADSPESKALSRDLERHHSRRRRQDFIHRASCHCREFFFRRVYRHLKFRSFEGVHGQGGGVLVGFDRICANPFEKL